MAAADINQDSNNAGWDSDAGAENAAASSDDSTAFDPFEGITIVYNGTSPGNGSVKEVLPGDDEICQELVYWVGETNSANNLTNGDTIAIRAYHERASKGETESYLTEHYGKTPTRLTAEITVEGIPHIVQSVAEIPQDELDALIEGGKEALKECIIEKWDKEDAERIEFAEAQGKPSGYSTELISIEYAGNFFALAQDMSLLTSQVTYNFICPIYQITARHVSPDEDVTATYYWVCKIDCLSVTDDGSDFRYNDEYQLQWYALISNHSQATSLFVGGHSISGGGGNFWGTETMQELYDEFVEGYTRADDYSYEVNF